jgi:Outer membrane protein beta-barrel domain
MKNCVLTLAAAAAVLFGATATASAQGSAGTTTNPTYELSAGYQLFHAGKVCNNDPVTETCSADRTFPLGVAVDAARNFGAFGVVGEVGFAFDSEESAGEEFNFNTWHLAGGGRWTMRSARFWPYAQVLAGMIQDRLNIDAGDDFSQTSFMLQPGIGANFVAGDGWGVFAQVDYRRVFLDEEENLSDGRNDFRLFIGARMILD